MQPDHNGEGRPRRSGPQDSHADQSGNRSQSIRRVGQSKLTHDGDPRLTPEYHRRLNAPVRGSLEWLALVDPDVAVAHLVEVIGRSAVARLGFAISRLEKGDRHVG